MIRAVLAVLLAVALLGVTFPALEDAREERSTLLVESELDTIEAAAVELIRTEETIQFDEAVRVTNRAGTQTAASPSLASRRSLSISVPGRDLAEAPVEYVAIGGVPSENGSFDDIDDRGGVLAYQLTGDDVRVRHVPLVFRVLNRNGTIAPEGTPLVLRGDSELTLSLVELDGDRIVLVQRG